MRPRYLRRAIGGHVHSAVPSLPHGHGFAASTSWNFAGKLATAFARWIAIVPDSSGWRSTSSTADGNSGASSRNSTPCEARAAAPGRMSRLPPPTIAAAVAVWCGAS